MRTGDQDVGFVVSFKRQVSNKSLLAVAEGGVFKMLSGEDRTDSCPTEQD
jgi:hypothetical protein